MASTARTWESGRLQTSRSRFAGAQGHPEDSLAGTVLDADTGHPLAGVAVGATVQVLGPGPGRPPTVRVVRETAAGSAQTDAQGRFRIDLPAAGEARADLSLLADPAAARLVLRVGGAARGAPYLESAPIERDGHDPVTLLVPLPRPVLPDDTWKTLANRMAQAHLTRIDELIRGLVATPPEISPFAEWTLEQRHAIALAIELDFLDPDGSLRPHATPPTFHALHFRGELKGFVDALVEPAGADAALDAAAARAFARLSSFRSLREVDWPIDLDELGHKRIGPALGKAQPMAAAALGEALALGKVDSLVPATPMGGELIAYRDYLREIVLGAPSPGVREPFVKLNRRFHQDFGTQDLSLQPSNRILIGILKAILVAPTGPGYGFGLAESDVAPQGDRSDREALDALIERSGVDAHTLGLRYRLSLDRPDTDRSSAVGQNIATLQALLQDGFQSAGDPFEPIIPPSLLGTAPFFLRYDEWRALRAPFYAENHLPMKESFTSRIDPDDVEKAINHSQGHDDWFVELLAAEQALISAHRDLRDSQRESARNGYIEAQRLATYALSHAPGSQAAADAGMKAWPVEQVLAPVIDQLHAIEAADAQGLQTLVDTVAPVAPLKWPPQTTEWPQTFRNWLKKTYPRHLLSLARLALFIAPACLADMAAADGDHETANLLYAEATRFLVGAAGLGDPPGWVQNHAGGHYHFPSLTSPMAPLGSHAHWRAYRRGGLPYTADVSGDPHPFEADAPSGLPMLARQLAGALAHPVERKWLRLGHADALLGWADALYRADRPADLERARELYKAVLFLHGISPGISPSWNDPAPQGAVGSWQAALGDDLSQPLSRNTSTLQLGRTIAELGRGAPALTPAARKPVFNAARTPQFASLTTVSGNPRRVQQVQHAAKCLLQMRAGLNVYGLNDAHVPVLRYAPLKAAADRFTADAKLAQGELVAYVGKVEDALQASLVNAHLKAKAQLQADIATEQEAVAAHHLALAERQVEAIEGEIDATREQLNEEKEFFNQAVTFFTGMKSAIDGLTEGGGAGKDLVSTGKSGLGSAAGVGNYEAAGTFSGLSAGAGATAGFALFVYAGVSSMQAMGAMWDSLSDKIKDLENNILPLARAEVALRERSVKIAQMERQIALSDAALAQQLIDFASTRFLDLDFWNQMVDLARRLLRRYLELATAHAWLAERALAYEQDRRIGIVALDYMPAPSMGIGGADKLRADLAELEANRIASAQGSVPITRMVSLAFEHPLSFAQLKATGRCVFPSEALTYRHAHPGTYGHRVRAVTVRALTASGVAQPQGLLSNPGVSRVRQRHGGMQLALRAADALPVSGFRLRRDQGVFGLPGETLMSFEGSGIDTLWVLELPPAANPQGLDGLLDVELVFDLQAHYSAALHAADAAAGPTSVQRALVVSAAHHAPQTLAALRQGAGAVAFGFDLGGLCPAAETQRRLKQLAVLVAGVAGVDGQATLGSPQAPLSVPFALSDGIALSDLPPFAAGDTATSPLNAFADIDPAQAFVLTLDPAAFPAADFATASDVVLAVEYAAEV
jgi:hypothetical protein